MNKFKCHACAGNEFEEDTRFKMLKRVTSDCRPWPSGGEKLQCKKCGLIQSNCDQRWKSECQNIYSGYDLFYQSDGEEQPIFIAGGLSDGRSNLVLDHIQESIKQSEYIKVLDVGCGNGGFLSATSKRFPGLELYGLESGNKYENRVRAISGVVDFYQSEIDQIQNSFDLVTMIHVLEHIDNPIKFLKSLREKIKPGGALFVQIPDCSKNPFDLLVADHSSHFSVRTLSEILKAAGASNIKISTQAVTKEISAWVTFDDKHNDYIESEPETVELKNLITKVCAIRDSINSDISAGREVAIFGTSNSGTWLANEADLNIKYFVDEDEARVGRRHLNIPIIRPNQLSDEIVLHVPLSMDVLKMILPRLPKKLTIRAIQD